ncbi:MAG: hypothetical protein LIR50_05345 [Bacillota bacterium]|nr:hypothetical protein [Bacillota bacterium]
MIKYLDLELDIYEELENLLLEDEINLLINNIKKDKRFNTNVSEDSIFFRESDIEQLIKDYPQLQKILQESNTLEEYIQWTYGNEDIYIEDDNYTFQIKADEIVNEIKEIMSFDDNIFGNLKQEIKGAVHDAKINLVGLYLHNLIDSLKQYTLLKIDLVN